MKHFLRIAATLLFSTGVLSSAARSQDAPVWSWGEAHVGSEMERYLRSVQLDGATRPPVAWSVRSFSPAEVDSLLSANDTHPWRARVGSGGAGRAALELLPVTVEAVHNSGFPFGFNDGAVWKGRGFTSVAQVGVAGRRGPFSMVFAPLAFWSQNRAFQLAPTGESDDRRFADAATPGLIDLPQRFGDGNYGRVDLGQSTVRADFRYVAVGLSSASQGWGPAERHPFLLGPNAPGFVHAFVGTGQPLDLGIGTVSARLMWGRLEQSDYAVAPIARRFATGIVAAFVPTAVPGLELGAGRFFHNSWPAAGLRPLDLLQPLGAVLKQSRLAPGDTLGYEPGGEQNQLASVFARWSLPESGLELFAEYGRDDHNYDLRDLALEPDHISAYTLGIRKGWRASRQRLVVLRAEGINGRRTHLQRARGQAALYVHTPVVQGHTHRGQILGAPEAYGGAGTTVGVDTYSPAGRWSLEWHRWLRREAHTDLQQDPEIRDAVHTLELSALRLGGRISARAGVAASYEWNRDLAADAFNLQLRVALLGRP